VLREFWGAGNSFRRIVDNRRLLRNKFRAPICPSEWPPKHLRCESRTRHKTRSSQLDHGVVVLAAGKI